MSGSEPLWRRFPEDGPDAAALPLGVRPLPPVRPTRTHIVLFVATVLSTLTMYPLLQGVNPLTDRAALLDAIAFSATLLTILGVHELGHFFVGRHYRVDVSLPYFIPAPNLLGTFGAVIRIRSGITHRPALLMIGAAGPIAGFLVAVPALVVGIASSEVGVASGEAGLFFGTPLLFDWIAGWIHGPLGEEDVMMLSSVAFAAWAGLFLTAFNLLPLGQLDGGHVIYALLGRRTSWVSVPVLLALVGLGVWMWQGWLVLGVLVFIFGLRHPPVERPGVPLRGRHLLVAALCVLIFALSFTTTPIVIV